MKYIRIKKLALAIVSVVTIASTAMPVNAASANQTVATTDVSVDFKMQEEAAKKELRKYTIMNSFTLEAKYASTKHSKNFGYICYRPEESKEEAKPLIVYLHGKDGCGTNPQRLLQIEGIPNYIGLGLIYPDAVVIAPQCPVGSNWVTYSTDVMQLIEKVIVEENIDPTRISLTGASLGGIGTFYMGYTYPEFFSAIVPVCGNVNAARCKVITNTPVRIYHGTLDRAMGFSCKDAHNYILAAGGTSELTMLEGEGHEIRHVYYDEEYDLINWMISQQRVDETLVEETAGVETTTATANN